MNNIPHIKKIFKTIGCLVLIVLGVFLVVFGEGDDSPGAQGLGLLLAIGGVVGTFKVLRDKAK